MDSKLYNDNNDGQPLKKVVKAMSRTKKLEVIVDVIKKVMADRAPHKAIPSNVLEQASSTSEAPINPLDEKNDEVAAITQGQIPLALAYTSALSHQIEGTKKFSKEEKNPMNKGKRKQSAVNDSHLTR